MNENLAFIYGVCVGGIAGIALSWGIFVVSVWRSARRDAVQAWEDGQ